MPKLVKHLLIGSTEASSGKSAVVLAIAFQLQAQGLALNYGKPLASVQVSGEKIGLADTDLNFIPTILGLTPEACRPTLISLSEKVLAEQIGAGGEPDFNSDLQKYWDDCTGDVVLLEGPSTLEEGALVKLSLPDMAAALDASVLLVMRYTRQMVDQLISAQGRLGEALIGVVINGVAEDDAVWVSEKVVPYLEQRGIPVVATLPHMPFLRGMRVSEIVRHLDAEVLCCADHLDLIVESLKIGAMNVNAALRFFSQGHHQAVVTGGDRRDLQIAALETSTHCLILTGQIAPAKDVIDLARDKEVPVLTVATDTLSTVESIDALFGHVPLNNPDKVRLVRELMAEEVDIVRLMSLLALPPPAIA
ncbi:phosphotransacetylase family protein [Leptolyngbya sp. PCC 6406]|uniref:phosphotransacetylase family protein n=1 Tax=Leptolyngbya sp. PCC 6406 TaxID=1173264 RepID=UPI0002AC2844|nr:phosphotransacetylase family protein [Leptolyngbya sp. PCC 6406]